MIPITLNGVDARLKARYQRMVIEQTHPSGKLSAGIKAMPDNISSFASTQAAWRFYQNEAIGLDTLQEPLTVAAYKGIAAHCDHYALCIHDWSRLAYKHANKQDTYAITHDTDIGYDLQSSVVISDREGQPIAPVAQRLVSANGSYATYYENSAPVAEVKDHLDEVCDCIDHIEAKGFANPLVHIIDREADSVFHLRHLDAKGYRWLIRANDNPRVEHHGQSQPCKAVAKTLAFNRNRQVSYHGKLHQQEIAETTVRLIRAAKPSSKKGKKPTIPGEPVEVRLVVARVVSDDGVVLAEWLLLTNVADIDASTIALWYYWRWKIESFFKLLKSAGHQLESWQQESDLAIFKRLLVVSMSCVTVWQIAADNSKEAFDLREFLIKLSGRQVARNKGFTHPALLAGLWVFLSMLEVLDNYSQEELDMLKKTVFQIYGKDV